MDQTALGLRTTAARKSFKVNSGQNNHFLITILVGLDAVSTGRAELSPDFSTSWSPKDVNRSAQRSREYAIKTSLAWITDLVDEYRKSITKMSGVLDGKTVSRIESEDSRSLKLRKTAKALGLGETPEELLVRLAIHWRNLVVHSAGRRNLDRPLRNRLEESAEHFARVNRGLDISSAIIRAEAGEAPRFKEIASIISAAHDLVQQIDTSVVAMIDLEKHADVIIGHYLANLLASGETNCFAKLWPGSTDKTSGRLRQILLQSGMSPVGPNECSLAPTYIERFVALTPSEARRRFSAQTATGDEIESR
jgi:hypothetical protein